MLFSPFGVPASEAALESISRCLFHLSVADLEWDGVTGAVVARSGHTAVLARAGSATCTDARGATYTAVANQLPLEARDWLNAGSRQSLGLLLGTGDTLPFAFAALPMGLAFYAEFVETAAGGFRFSLSNAGLTGARLVLDSVGGAYRLLHHNGTSSVSTTHGTPTSSGQRIRLRGVLGADGSVQLWQGVNEAAEVASVASGTLVLSSAWAANASIYVNSNGTTPVGQAWLRRLKLVAGNPSLTLLQELD